MTSVVLSVQLPFMSTYHTPGTVLRQSTRSHIYSCVKIFPSLHDQLALKLIFEPKFVLIKIQNLSTKPWYLDCLCSYWKQQSEYTWKSKTLADPEQRSWSSTGKDLFGFASQMTPGTYPKLHLPEGTFPLHGICGTPSIPHRMSFHIC